jgi:hypothetical protein
MSKKILLFLSCFFYFCLPLQSWGWNAVGHKVIAAIAYQHLTPQAKTQVNAILRADNFGEYPLDFVGVASWPDLLGSHDIQAFSHWHYIDLPWVVDPQQKTIALNPENVVWAINQCQQVLQSKQTNPVEKAFFLRFLIHLVGDIHQPLHCISRVNAQYPNGDRGGLDILLDSPLGKNLHSVWDNGLGLFQTQQRWHKKDIYAQAAALDTAALQATLGSKVSITDPQQWAQEGHSLAQQYVYLANFKGGLTPDYIQANQKIVTQQVVLAGWRLANLLNQDFT